MNKFVREEITREKHHEEFHELKLYKKHYMKKQRIYRYI